MRIYTYLYLYNIYTIHMWIGCRGIVFYWRQNLYRTQFTCCVHSLSLKKQYIFIYIHSIIRIYIYKTYFPNSYCYKKVLSTLLISRPDRATVHKYITLLPCFYFSPATLLACTLYSRPWPVLALVMWHQTRQMKRFCPSLLCSSAVSIQQCSTLCGYLFFPIIS